MLADARFVALADSLSAEPGVTVPGGERQGFGSNALKVDGSIFAMLTGDQLTLKLPAPRVAQLIDEGAGLPFDAGKGRPMKEWVTLAAGDSKQWKQLSREALAFVRKRSV